MEEECVCFIDIGKGSSIDIDAVFDTLDKLNKYKWTTIGFSDQLIPIDRNYDSKCLLTSDASISFSLAYQWIRKQQIKYYKILFFVQHLIPEPNVNELYHAPNWIVISDRLKRNELFVHKIKAVNFYFSNDVDILLESEFNNEYYTLFQMMLAIEQQKQNETILKGNNRLEMLSSVPLFSFHGEIIKCQATLLNPYFAKIKTSQFDNPINTMILYDDSVIVSYQNTTSHFNQMIISFTLRGYFTQNQNDLFALQCCFFLEAYLNDRNRNLLILVAENIALLMTPYINKILFHSCKPSRKKLFIESKVQSLSHLFAILFALQITQESKLDGLSPLLFSKLIVFETLKNLMELSPLTFTLQDILIDFYEDDIFSTIELTKSFSEQLNEQKNCFFFHLIDPYKCKKILRDLNDNGTNINLYYSLQLLSKLFKCNINLKMLFEEPEKFLIVAMISRIEWKYFEDITVRNAIENHLKLYLHRKFLNRYEIYKEEKILQKRNEKTLIIGRT